MRPSVAEGSPQALSSSAAFSLCLREARDLRVGDIVSGSWALAAGAWHRISPCLRYLPDGSDSQDPRIVGKGQFGGMGRSHGLERAG